MQDYRRDAWRLALATAIVLAIAWAPYLFFGKTLLASAADVPSMYPAGAAPLRAEGTAFFRSLDPGAPGWQNEPWLALEHRLLFDEHVLPMWDPYDGYGVPFAASMIAQPFYPLAFAASIDPTPFTYNLLVLGRLFLVALGCALFVRMFTGFAPALVAGVCAAFSGYFLIYVDIVHIGVEVMLPWLLLGVEVVIRRTSPRSAALLAAAWGISLLGGMPESSALASLVVLSYATFRVILERADGRSLQRLGWCVCGLGVGSAIAAVVLLPFFEYLQQDFDVHQQNPPGLDFDEFSRAMLLTEFSPLALGPPLNSLLNGFSGHTGFRGAPGIFAIFFACVASITAIAAFAQRRVIDRVALFLVVVAAGIEAKRYGCPLVQWVGALPVFRLVEFAKYGEAIVAVCIAIAAGFGVAAVVERRFAHRLLLIATVVVLGVATWLYNGVSLPPSTPHVDFFYAAIALLLSIFALSVALSVLGTRTGNTPALTLLFAGVAFCEGCFALLFPMYYMFDRPVSAARNPYAGAPYVQYLSDATRRDGERVVGTGDVLFPDWSSAFGIYDTRDLSAMYPSRYLPFINAFMPGALPALGDRINRFSGQLEIDYDDALVRRWMLLSSVRYAISSKPIAAPIKNGILADLWAQNGAAIPPARASAVHLTSAEIDGVAESALFDHPPDSTIHYTTTPPAKLPWLAVDVALDPTIWSFGCGGAVSFTLQASNAANVPIASAVRTIDPKHLVSDRHWNRLALDLRAARGQPVDVRFTTSVPPGGDLCAAWALWGAPRWTAVRDAQPLTQSGETELRRIPSVSDVNLYRFDRVLPRLSLFHQREMVLDGAQSLAVITSKTFDAAHTVVLEGAAAPAVSLATQADRIDVRARSSQRVEAEVTTSSDAVLLQNDSWYPGWEATIDGVPTPILRADYLFRGIAVPAGHHSVVIAYRSRTVSIGLATSIIGLLALAAMIALTPATSRSLAAAYSRRRARA